MISAHSPTAELGFAPQFDVLQFLNLQLQSSLLPKVTAQGNVIMNNGPSQAYISAEN